MAQVDDMQEQFGLHDLFERGFERFDQACGSLRMKPTVSVSNTFWFVGRRSRRVVGSSVANILSSARAAAPVSVLSRVDLPALV